MKLTEMRFTLNIFPQIKCRVYINLPILFARFLLYIFFSIIPQFKLMITIWYTSLLFRCFHTATWSIVFIRFFFTKKDIKRNKSCCSYILPSISESFDQMAWFVSELCSFTFHQIQYLFNLSCSWIWIIYQWYINV